MENLLTQTKFNIEVIPGGKLPTKAHSTDSDWDIYARLDEPVVIPPGGRALIPAGFKAEIPPGWRFKLETRSGKGWKEGFLIGAGVIDAGFENEIGVIVHNMNPPVYEYVDTECSDGCCGKVYVEEIGVVIEIKPGDKIAQFVIERVWDTELVQVDSIKEQGERGKNGFGSSDKV